MRNASRVSGLTLAAALMLGPAACSRSPPPGELEPVRTAGGLTVYLGVLPAALIRGHDAGTSGAMHAAPGPTSATHHVTVAAFDAASGARITDATVIATVAERIGAPATRRLEPMTVAGAATYGNFFALAKGDAPVAIAIRIERAGQVPVRVEFAYRHGP